MAHADPLSQSDVYVRDPFTTLGTRAMLRPGAGVGAGAGTAGTREERILVSCTRKNTLELKTPLYFQAKPIRVAIENYYVGC